MTNEVTLLCQGPSRNYFCTNHIRCKSNHLVPPQTNADFSPFYHNGTFLSDILQNFRISVIDFWLVGSVSGDSAKAVRLSNIKRINFVVLNVS